MVKPHSLFSILLFASAAIATRLHGQTAVEGTVQLPKATSELGINQRYQTSGELPIAPMNPPAAVVYLEGDFSHMPRPAANIHAQMPQKNIMFTPDLVAVLVGTTVEFPNLDDTYHNVFSYSKPKRFDLGRYRKDDKAATILFDKPGTVTLHCDIHDRMRGTILVLESPFFTKTDSAGRYRLDHLPAGNYLLKAWVTDRDVRERSVELKKGATLRIDFPGK